MIELTKVLELFDELFELPEETLELLKVGGMSERQAKAVVMLADEHTITQIAMETAGSKYTQNAYDAIRSGYSKFFEAIILAKVVTENNMIMQTFLDQLVAKKKLDVPVDFKEEEE